MRDDECFNCAGAAEGGTYTIVLPNGEMLREKTLCEPCTAAFRDESGVEIHAEPVLVRGDDEE